MENKNIEYIKPSGIFTNYIFKAIPLAFDESMSYYETLCGVLDLLKNTVDVVNNNAELLAELESYVKNYFDNLDVQEEINNKLDEMIEDGTFEEILDDKLFKKVDYYEITTQTESEVQNIFNIDRPKIVSFKNNYTFTETKRLSKNTTILLNSNTLTFNIPSMLEDWTQSHGFFNFNDNDEFLAYNGNGNIHIKNGTIIGGNCSFIHGSNISFENINFLNCKNDHILELCAVNNVKIISCTFNGTVVQTSISNMSKEYIQWENATQTNFPHFSNSLSPTYDNTACKNISIESCYFIRPDNLEYEFYTACGNHNFVAGYPHENVTINNCNFNNPRSVTINFYNTNNVNITNNNFIGNNNIAISDYTCHVRTRGKCDNIVIKNNTFNQSFRAIENSPNDVNNNWLIENNIFSDYNLDSQTYTSATYSIIDVDSISNLNINNNRFNNYLQKAIHIDNSLVSTYSSLLNEYINITNNTFDPEKSLNAGMIHITYGHIVLLNNNYNITGFNSNYHYIIQVGGGENLQEIISKNNIFNDYVTSNAKYIIRDTSFTYQYKKIFDYPFTGYYTTSSGGTNLSFSYNVFNFNTMRIMLSSSNGSFSTILRSWDATRKIDARA